MRYYVDVCGETVELQVEQGSDGNYRVRGRAPHAVELSVSSLARHATTHTLSLAGQVLEVQLSEGEVKLGRERFSFQIQSERDRVATRSSADDARSSKEIVAPMPGRIISISCMPGDAVPKDTSLVVIEAMKMQNELCAKADSVVRAVHVAIGDTVDRGAVLLEFE